MTVLLIAGLPEPLERRLRSYVQAHPDEVADGVTFHWFAGGGKKAGLGPASFSALIKTAAKFPVDSVLIISQRPVVEAAKLRDRVQPYFRCRLVSADVIRGIYPTAEVAVRQLNEAASIESSWLEKIRPTSAAHPLLLPRGVFAAGAHFTDVWRAAANASSLIGIRETACYVTRFGDGHRVRRHTDGRQVFKCVSDLNWDYQGPKHATAPFPRDWKFSFKLPDGFHFDVENDRSAAFRLRDAEGFEHRREAGEHMNVDPHGRVR